MINLNEVGIATGTGTIAGHTRALYVGSDIKGVISGGKLDRSSG
jgi:hypothetical protein